MVLNPHERERLETFATASQRNSGHVAVNEFGGCLNGRTVVTCWDLQPERAGQTCDGLLV